MSLTPVSRSAAIGIATLATATLLAGCGSNSGSKQAATAVVGSAASTSSPSGAATAASPSSSTSSGPATVQPPTSGGGGNAGAFCATVAQIAADAAKANVANSDNPADLKKTVEAFGAAEGPLLKSAPAQIKPDLTNLFGYLDQVYGALQNADYDWTKVDATTLATIATTSQDIETSSDNVTAYIAKNCGIALDSASPAN